MVPNQNPGGGRISCSPPKADYQDPGFPATRLRMLAVKTTCKDRWRQVLNEAARIPAKHLLTLQEGVSENQFREMTESGVRLVVPNSHIKCFHRKDQARTDDTRRLHSRRQRSPGSNNWLTSNNRVAADGQRRLPPLVGTAVISHQWPKFPDHCRQPLKDPILLQLALPHLDGAPAQALPALEGFAGPSHDFRSASTPRICDWISACTRTGNRHVGARSNL